MGAVGVAWFCFGQATQTNDLHAPSDLSDDFVAMPVGEPAADSTPDLGLARRESPQVPTVARIGNPIESHPLKPSNPTSEFGFGEFGVGESESGFAEQIKDFSNEVDRFKSDFIQSDSVGRQFRIDSAYDNRDRLGSAIDELQRQMSALESERIPASFETHNNENRPQPSEGK